MDMNKRMNPTGYGIDDGKCAHLMPNCEPFFAPLVGKGIRLPELEIHEGAAPRFWRDYFEIAGFVYLDWKPSISSLNRGVDQIVRRYTEADE